MFDLNSDKTLHKYFIRVWNIPFHHNWIMDIEYIEIRMRLVDVRRMNLL